MAQQQLHHAKHDGGFAAFRFRSCDIEVVGHAVLQNRSRFLSAAIAIAVPTDMSAAYISAVLKHPPAPSGSRPVRPCGG
jgi:hypothetical protein